MCAFQVFLPSVLRCIIYPFPICASHFFDLFRDIHGTYTHLECFGQLRFGEPPYRQCMTSNQFISFFTHHAFDQSNPTDTLN